MTALALRLTPVAERVNHLTLRERVLVFAATVTVVFVAWQVLLMDGLTARQRAATQELVGLQERLATFEASGSGAGGELSGDPLLQAAQRERVLREQLGNLDAELGAASSGFVEPARMALVVRSVLATQSGLTLVSLRNLPIENLLPVAEGQKPRGPFLHPLEIVVEGDYASVVAYLDALGGLPWRFQWRVVDLAVQEYPINRARIEIGTLSLSPEWLSVGVKP